LELELVDKFCDFTACWGKGDGDKEASRTRVRCAWCKFIELAPILTFRGASLRFIIIIDPP